MREITHFKLLSAVYTHSFVDAAEGSKLERQINEQIAMGWQPFGNLVASAREGAVIFVQPMVKYGQLVGSQ